MGFIQIFDTASFPPISPFRLSDMYREVAFSIGKQTSEEEKNTVMAAQKDLMSLKKITENYLYGDSMSSEGKAYPRKASFSRFKISY